LGGYKFEGRRGLDAPRLQEYTFYIAAKDNSGNYSESTKVTIQHPGISQLDLSETDLVGRFNSISITLPTPLSVRSQRVYLRGEPQNEDNPEEKDILGYRIYVWNLDEHGEESREYKLENAKIVDFDAEEIEEGEVLISVDSNTKYEIAVGCFDSVYHWNHNEDLYENTISDFVQITTASIEPIDISEALIKPNELTETLNTPEEGIKEKITLMAGNYEEGISGGLGLKYDEGEEGVDVQVVANRFRLFKEDDLEGTALFAVGEVDNEEQIYMEADKVAIRSEFNYDDFEDDDFLFELSNKGLQIDTPNLFLDKQGNAEFIDGEVKASNFIAGDKDVWDDSDGFDDTSGVAIGGNGTLDVGDGDNYLRLAEETFEIKSNNFSFISNNLEIDTEGITADEFSLNAETGKAEFSGSITVGDGALVMDDDGLRAYDPDDNKTVEVKTDDGEAYFNGYIEARGFELPIRSV